MRYQQNDSATSVILCVSGKVGHYGCNSACKRWRSAAKAKPHHALTAYRSLPTTTEQSYRNTLHNRSPRSRTPNDDRIG